MKAAFFCALHNTETGTLNSLETNCNRLPFLSFLASSNFSRAARIVMQSYRVRLSAPFVLLVDLSICRALLRNSRILVAAGVICFTVSDVAGAVCSGSVCGGTSVEDALVTVCGGTSVEDALVPAHDAGFAACGLASTRSLNFAMRLWSVLVKCRPLACDIAPLLRTIGLLGSSKYII